MSLLKDPSQNAIGSGHNYHKRAVKTCKAKLPWNLRTEHGREVGPDCLYFGVNVRMGLPLYAPSCSVVLGPHQSAEKTGCPGFL